MGIKVKYIGNVCEESINWCDYDDPRDILNEGCIYEIERKEIHTWHTNIFLKNIDGCFNSVWFEEI